MSLTKATYSMIYGAPANVLDFGAVGDGVTNDYAAFVAAALFLQNQGGGKLVIPYTPTGYSITCPSNNGAVCSFSNLNLLTIEGYGAYIKFENTYSSGQGNVLFQFDACTNISISNFFVFNNYTKTVSQSGVRFAYFLNACRNVSIDDITFWGGLALVQIYKAPANGYGPTNQASGFKIGRVNVKNAWYGINCQYNGDDISIENLSTEDVVRSYFVYGVKHHKAFIRSKNNIAEDVAISTLDGFGCENIDIDYINTESTASALGSRGACFLINLVEGTTTPSAGTIRNIKANITAKSVADGIAYGFAISCPDAAGIGHVLENVELRGSLYSTWATFNPIRIAVDYPATGNNFLRNIRIKDVYVSGTTGNSIVDCRNINYMKLEGVTTPAACYIINGADGAKILVENCEATTFSDDTNDPTSVQFTNVVATVGTGQALKNKTIVNSKISTFTQNLMPRAWAVLDPTGVIKSSVAVSSASKTSTGIYEITFATTYTAGSYCGLANISGGALYCEVVQTAGNKATVNVFNASGVAADPTNEVMFVLFANPVS